MLEKIRYDQRYATLPVVIRCRSFAGAARELALTPSAVSAQVRSLERELSVPLFTTVKKELVPTDKCRLVAEYIEKIQSVCRRMSDEVESARSGMERLQVGITPSAENFVLAGVLDAITAANPAVQVRVTTGVAEMLYPMLQNLEIDLAIVEGGATPAGLCEVILDTDHLSVAVPVDSVWARRGVIRLAELKKEPLILRPRESGTGRLFHSGLISAGVPEKELRVMLEAESVDTIVRLVAGGYGLSVLSDKACAAYVAAGKIAAVRLEGMNLSRSIRILYRPGSKELQRLVGAIQKNYHTVPGEYPGGQQKEHGAL